MTADKTDNKEVAPTPDPNPAREAEQQTAGVSISKIEGEHVDIGHIVGGDLVSGDQITVSDVHDSAVAVKGGIAIKMSGGSISISYGQKQLLAIPLLAQVALGLLLLGVLFLVVIQGRALFKPPEALLGGFNVAVADFQVSGDGQGAEDAEDLADGFARAIERNRDQFSEEDVDVAHPGDIGQIKGQTDSERAASAQALAVQLKADIVIYGVIALENKQATVNPRFFLNDEEYVRAAEVTGEYRLGSPIIIPNISNNRLRSDAIEIFEKRIQALSYLTSGLSDFYATYYADATTKFNQALAIEAWDRPDIVYVWLGNVALQQKDWQTAYDYYGKAREENPEYARAYVGLATVALNQAVENVPEDSYAFDLGLLQEAIDNYNRALQSEEQPATANISTNVGQGLGEASLRQALALEALEKFAEAEAAYAQATQQFQAIVADFEAGNTQIQWQAAHAHASLALIAWQKGQGAVAKQEYETAIKLLETSDYLRAREDIALYQEFLDLLNAGDP